MARPSDLDPAYTSVAEIEDRLSAEGVLLRLDDDRNGSASTPESDRGTYAVNIATARVNMYLSQRYAPADLAASWVVHDWATIIAARWICKRRANPVPESIEDDYLAAIEEMTAIRERVMALGGVTERQSDQPTLSNMTLDNRYRVRQLRRQSPLSTREPTTMPTDEHIPGNFQAAAEDGR